MLGRKFELTGETKMVGNRKLYRIRAVVNIPGVKKGKDELDIEDVVGEQTDTSVEQTELVAKQNENDFSGKKKKREVWKVRPVLAGELGGWIERENNLSHCGNCWVADEAMVYEEAFVRGDSRVEGDAVCRGYVTITNNVVVGKGSDINGIYTPGNNLLIDEDDLVIKCVNIRTMGGYKKYIKKVANDKKQRILDFERKYDAIRLAQFRSNIVRYEHTISEIDSMLSADNITNEEREVLNKKRSSLLANIERTNRSIWKIEHPAEWLKEKARRSKEAAEIRKWKKEQEQSFKAAAESAGMTDEQYKVHLEELIDAAQDKYRKPKKEESVAKEESCEDESDDDTTVVAV